MLIAVIKNIMVFLVILLIVIFGFADTFFSLSKSTIFVPKENFGDYPESAEYIDSFRASLQYSYQIVLGEFGDIDNYDPLTYLFFVLATILSMLILANMLIEIVGQTYGEVLERKYLYVFKERVMLIVDWQTSFSVFRFLNFMMTRIFI